MSTFAADLGRNLVLQSVTLLRLLQSYDSTNLSVSDSLDRLVDTLNACLNRERSVDLEVLDGAVICNGERVQPSPTQNKIFSQFIAHLQARNLAGFRFQIPASRENLRQFYLLLGKEAETIATIPEANYQQMGVMPLMLSQEGGAGRAPLGSYAYILGAFADAATAYDRVVMGLKEGHPLPPLLAGAQEASRLLVQAAEARLDLIVRVHKARVRRGHRLPRSHQALHAAGTAMYSLFIGRMLGMSSSQLAELTQLSLLAPLAPHLIGGPTLSLRQVPSPPALAAMIQASSPVLQSCLSQQERLGLLALCTFTDYQLPPHMQGQDGQKAHLYTRIITVASAYEALLMPPEGEAPQNPAEALKTMVRAPDKRFDPVVLTTLTTALGTYLR